MRHITKIDAHQHLWDVEKNYYPWLTEGDLEVEILGDYSALRRNYLIDDYLADIAHQNVVKSVHLHGEWDYDDPVGETRWLQAIADRHGYPHGIVSYANLADPAVEYVLEQHAAFSNMRGIRMLLNWDEDPALRAGFAARGDYLVSDDWRSGYRLLEKYGFSYDFQIYWRQMADAADVARSFPNIQTILDHTGMPIDRSEDGVRGWREGMRRLAAEPNTAVKISALGVIFQDEWSVEAIRPFVLDTIEMFGVERTMFAGNFPVDRIFLDYDSIFDAYGEIVSDFSATEIAMLFHDSAARIYRV